MKTIFFEKKMYAAVFSVVLMFIFSSCSTNERLKDLVVDVESISLNTSSVNLLLNESKDLIVTFNPAGATDKKVSWSSSDTGVATVSSGGTVQAVGVGTAIITVRSSNGKTATCTVSVSSSTVNVESIELDRNALSLTVGASGVLIATIKPLNATNKTIVWESDNTQIVTVDNSGRVFGISTGSAKITAKAGSFSAICNVSVTSEGIPATKIELNKISLSLAEGAEEQLKATVSPSNTTDLVVWQSLNPQIATVDNSGTVKAIGLGTANIVAKAGDKTETCVVTVTPASESEVVTAIALSKTSLALINGGSETILATVTTTDGSKPVVSWVSSNIQVATVDGGVITAVGVGEAVITATAGNKSATCAVTITSAPESEIVKAIVLSKESLTLMTGGFETISATVTTSDGSKPTVSWTSSNIQIATVDNHGEVTAEGVGEAIITATAGNKSAQCKVTVTSVFVAITGVQVSPSAYTMTVGQELQLSAQIAPLNSTSKEVSWQSEKPNMATVGIMTGLVKALSVGKVMIFAIAEENHNITGSCEITIVPEYIPVTSISLDEMNLVLTEGGKHSLSADIMPSNATVQTVTWISQNKSVATVDSHGEVTAVAKGMTVITAEADGKSVFCNVTVEAQEGQTVDFADEIFEAFLLNKFDSDKNGKISTSEIKDVTELYCNSQNITSLDGIEHFKSLRILDCHSNNISSVDLSRNSLLTSLDCESNQISSLEVDMLTNLEVLKCGNNNLSAIDVSRNNRLRVFSCSENNLSQLDVSMNPALTELYCASNNLLSINVSQNPKLVYFSCGDNNIGNLDVSNNPSLYNLYCQNCNLTSLSLNNNLKLIRLDCSSNKLQSLDLSAHDKLSILYCGNNQLSGDLDISSSKSIMVLDCRSNSIAKVYIHQHVKDLVDSGVIKPSNFTYDNEVEIEVK